MDSLTKEMVENEIADSPVIFQRGKRIYKTGNFYQIDADYERKAFNYVVDGNYGDYDVAVNFLNGDINYLCTCPYYSDGCKHTVAVCLDIIDNITRYKSSKGEEKPIESIDKSEELSYEEIKRQAIEDRKKKAQTENFKVRFGETYKGEHLVINNKEKEYVVTVHNPLKETGHCSCPDFNTNKLDSCKHLLYFYNQIKTQKDFNLRIKKEKSPYIHLYWSSALGKPTYFYDRNLPKSLSEGFETYFDNNALYKKDDLGYLYYLLENVKNKKNVKIDTHLFQKIEEVLLQKEIKENKDKIKPDLSVVNAKLYPYQKDGVNFAIFKKSTIIADEMGLGKTLQAIAIALLKREIFNMEKVLIICPASLKEQWKREIERFTNETAIVISGSKTKRQEMYKLNKEFFIITNYEAVLRDNMVIRRYKPDLIILDEAQRIKNFETKTAQCIKSIPHKQSLVISGTPLVNKLEDLYSIVQFADPSLFSPLWEFASDHFILKRDKKNKVFGYKNLKMINEKLKPLVIRRKKEEVLKDLPEQVTNNYYIDLTDEQIEIHQGYLASLLPILNKKFLTPIDMQRIQQLLTGMRMVCNSTFLIDRKTNLSPKLTELEPLLRDIILENKRKVVVFSEWTTMTFLIGKTLSEMGISFVEFTGKIPVAKRQNLINEFNQNPECHVFLSTDAGGVGLNLQTADCVVNFELPWNPAKLNQRIGRVIRIGQKSKCINVINFIAKDSIEEKIHAGNQLKQELFDGVFEASTDKVEFSSEKRAELINKVRAMLNEDPIVPKKESADPEDIPEATPHFLNPKALEDEQIDITTEEEESADEAVSDIQEPTNEKDIKECEPASTLATTEKMEEVLDNGMKFLNGLMVMGTGKPLMQDNQEKAISINKETGEVTMKFKLPGF